VKQITEIEDPRLVKALAHPLRISIMRLVYDRVASPSEIAAELEAPLGNVSYHVRYLERAGLLKLVRTRPRRGAVEHYYKAIGRLRITDRAWSQLPAIVKDAMVDATLGEALQNVRAAVDVGGFERSDAHLSRRRLVLDDAGFSELAEAMRDLLDRFSQIESDSAQRLAAENHNVAEINVGTVMMLFEAPPISAEPAARRNGARRTAGPHS
jgi:DNA-binding transcriptional ArsR family regulator